MYDFIITQNIPAVRAFPGPQVGENQKAGRQPGGASAAGGTAFEKQRGGRCDLHSATAWVLAVSLWRVPRGHVALGCQHMRTLLEPQGTWRVGLPHPARPGGCSRLPWSPGQHSCTVPAKGRVSGRDSAAREEDARPLGGRGATVLWGLWGRGQAWAGRCQLPGLGAGQGFSLSRTPPRGMGQSCPLGLHPEPPSSCRPSAGLGWAGLGSETRTWMGTCPCPEEPVAGGAL